MSVSMPVILLNYKSFLSQVPKFVISTIAAELWDEYQEFASATGMTFLMGLNALTQVNGSWFTGNARQLLEYSRRRGYCNINFELANGECLNLNKYY